MATYVALLRKDPESDYGVDFPDFPGCITVGRTVEEAGRMAAEALALHLEGMAEDGDRLPPPSTLDRLMRAPDNRDAIAFLVDVPGQTAGSERVEITLPEDILEAIDRVTKDRSRFLAEAARLKLSKEHTAE